jgi:hypothetical protein
VMVMVIAFSVMSCVDEPIGPLQDEDIPIVTPPPPPRP